MRSSRTTCACSGSGTVSSAGFNSAPMRGSRIVHNTWYDSGADDCDFDNRCGIMAFGHKTGDDVSRDTVIRDNIAAEISQPEGNQVESYNLLTTVCSSGLGDLCGMPLYAGGVRPTTYAGYKLVAGSLGKGAASDGSDMGARIP